MNQKNIFAFTPADASARPPFISLNDSDGYLVFTMRGYSGGGSYAPTDNITISKTDLQKMADGINAYLGTLVLIPAAPVALSDAAISTFDSEPYGWVLETGHGTRFSKIKPSCEVDLWKAVYLR